MNALNKRVMVTGATGYIGRHLLPLIKKSHDVIVVGRTNLGQTEHFLFCDLLHDNLSELCVQAEANQLIHLAWNVKGDYWNSSENQVWQEKSIELVQSFLSAGGKKVLVTGTCAEYVWDNRVCHEQSTALASNTAYARAKNKTHEVLSSLCKGYDATLIWARLFYSFGPGEPSYKLIPSLLNKLILKKTSVCRQGNQYLDYLYIKDLASALETVFLHSLGGPVNISSGHGTYLPELLMKLAEKCEAQTYLDVNLGAPELVRKVIGTHQQLLEFGWRPGYTLEQALTETITEWKQAYETHH